MSINKDALLKTFLNEKTLSYGQIMRVFVLLEESEKEVQHLRDALQEIVYMPLMSNKPHTIYDAVETARQALEGKEK